MKPVLNSCQVPGTGELSVPFSFFLKIQLLIKYAFAPIGCQACVGHRGFRGANDVAPALKGGADWWERDLEQKCSSQGKKCYSC